VDRDRFRVREIQDKIRCLPHGRVGHTGKFRKIFRHEWCDLIVLREQGAGDEKCRALT
jgi:hypothetical protein